MIRIFVGRDEAMPADYAVFCESVIARTGSPVAFSPVTGTRRDGSTPFAYSRFLVPYLCGFSGHAIWADGDMLCRADIAELWNLRSGQPVRLVQHDYRTRHVLKFRGQRNEDYPRKNWSSLMLINCGHPAWRRVTPQYVEASSGATLHRFEFLESCDIGALPKEWNWLVGEYPYDERAKIAHFTIGSPGFREYERCDYAHEWRAAQRLLLRSDAADFVNG